jgi:hypothetical protein
MKHFVVFYAFILMGLTAFAQKAPKAYYIDGVKATERETTRLKQDDIASVQMDNDGAHYYTKPMVRKKYWSYLSAKSSDYGKAVPNAADDSNVIYFLNGTMLSTDYEMTLYGINDENFGSIKIIDQATLQKLYGFTNKTYGVMIKTHKVKMVN